MSSITTWVSLIVQLLGIVGLVWWNIKKEEWAKRETEQAKNRDQGDTKEQNQNAQAGLDDAEEKNARDREEILKGLSPDARKSDG